jgi:hypothetical protein
MDILKTATDWAKTEVFSTAFFILFAVVFLFASVSFWQLGKSDIAKAYVIPTLVAGILLLIIGVGLVYANVARISSFEVAHSLNVSAFYDSEIARAEATLKEYQTIVFKAIPIIIAVCALGMVFISIPIWRASFITTIAMLTVILLIDGTAHGRIDSYYKQLVSVAEEQSKNAR